MPAQPATPSQNSGLIVLVVSIFMIILAFTAVTYFNGSKIDTIKTNQDKNSQVGKTERGNLTDITCALWRSIGDPARLDPVLRIRVGAVCPATASASPTP